jgi:hypothetical protein
MGLACDDLSSQAPGTPCLGLPLTGGLEPQACSSNVHLGKRSPGFIHDFWGSSGPHRGGHQVPVLHMESFSEGKRRPKPRHRIATGPARQGPGIPGTEGETEAR